MKFPEVTLTHLDNLWFQVSGTLCNIACTHCFNNSGPNVRTFEFLSLETVRESIESAARAGVKEIFFTGGEPFLH
ncbi:MAG TPA: radical SAM protein, partial [Terriglobia bacterium]|nr:radical SAM protein [Terriglobia bacterium]